MSTGGSIESVSIRGRNFSVAADADVTRKLGGFENEVQMNGNATARVVKTRVAWMLSGITIDVNDVRADHEFLQDIANGVNADVDGFFTVSITYASGAVYSGRGIITDTIEYASQNTTAGVSLSGPGELTKQ
jgi:hypothetical protein